MAISHCKAKRELAQYHAQYHAQECEESAAYIEEKSKEQEYPTIR
jgi:hypothetical protein